MLLICDENYYILCSKAFKLLQIDDKSYYPDSYKIPLHLI